MAGVVARSYWATFTIGRVLAGLYARKAGIAWIVQGSLAAALVGTILLIWNPAPIVNLLAVTLVGLAIAPVFVELMPATVHGWGQNMPPTQLGCKWLLQGWALLSSRVRWVF